MALCACGCGGVTMIRRGRPNRYMPSHNSRINRGRYVMRRNPNGGSPKNEHTFVAERALGKPLPEGAEVHHVDENKRNNAPSNLVICQDNAYHKLLHMRAKVVRLGGDPNTHKHCAKCDQIRPMDAFYFSAHRGGLVSTCKECCAKRWAVYSKNRKQTVAA